MITQRRTIPPAMLAGVLVVGACGRPTEVQIVATLEPGRPLPGLAIVAWPYDPARLLDSLAALAPRPRPDYAALEAELKAFRRPEFAEDDAETRAWAAVRDSVRRLSDSLGALDRRAPGYATAYERFRRLYERFQQRTAARDAGIRDVTAEVRALAMRAGRAADSVRAWEQEAYAGADSAGARAAAATGRDPITGSTDGAGKLALTLPAGAWWIEARVPHPENPFTEYRWLTPVVLSGFPLRAPLDGATGTLTWRH